MSEGAARVPLRSARSATSNVDQKGKDNKIDREPQHPPDIRIGGYRINTNWKIVF
jgi:hypothetical protein